MSFSTPIHDMGDVGIDLNRILIPNPHSTFFMRVKGPNMKHMGIYDGDYLVIDRSLNPQPNQAVVIAHDQDFLVRRWQQSRETVSLESDLSFDPDTPPPNECMIWGVVTYIIHKPHVRDDGNSLIPF